MRTGASSGRCWPRGWRVSSSGCGGVGAVTTARLSRRGRVKGKRFKRVCLNWTWSTDSHLGLRRVSRIKGRTHVSTRPRATPLLKISLAPQGASTHVAKFWRLPRVEHAGGICASRPEVADDPERPCREVEAPVEGRLQGPPLRGDADLAGRLVVPALSPELSRHRGAVPGARPGG